MRRWSDCLAGLGEQRTARVTAYLRAAAWAIVLAAMASGCTGFQLGGQPTQPPAEHFVNPAPAVTAYAAKPGSVCSNPTTTSPTDWLTVVCPAADALVVAQAGLRTLQRAAENLQAEESIADSAYSIQELNSTVIIKRTRPAQVRPIPFLQQLIPWGNNWKPTSNAALSGWTHYSSHSDSA